MGRPREHDERTRAALLAAAERIVAEGGPAALSVRAVADAAGTTTRAVYSLFGSKDGLLVEALARDAFEFLYHRDREARGDRRPGSRPDRHRRHRLPPPRARAPRARTASPFSASSQGSRPARSSRPRGREPGSSSSRRSNDSDPVRPLGRQAGAGGRRRVHRHDGRSRKRRATRGGSPAVPRGQRGEGLAGRADDARARVGGLKRERAGVCRPFTRWIREGTPV